MLSSVSRNKSTIGEMVNLMSVDAQRLMDILTYLNMLWSAPYQISVAIFFLYRTMGISVFAGVGVMLVIFPLNFLIGRRLRVFQVLMLFLLDLSVPILHIILDANKKKCVTPGQFLWLLVRDCPANGMDLFSKFHPGCPTYVCVSIKGEINGR